MLLLAIENGLTDIAAVPVIGAPFAGMKIAMGGVEIIIAVAMAIIGAIGSIFSRSETYSDLLEGGAKLGLRGFANIITGAVEAIPFVGILTCLHLNDSSNYHEWNYMHEATDHKLIFDWEY